MPPSRCTATDCLVQGWTSKIFLSRHCDLNHQSEKGDWLIILTSEFSRTPVRNDYIMHWCRWIGVIWRNVNKNYNSLSLECRTTEWNIFCEYSFNNIPFQQYCCLHCQEHAGGVLKKFCPDHLREGQAKANVTCSVYNYNGQGRPGLSQPGIELCCGK